MYILLEDAKKHLNIDEYFTDDDLYIISLIKAAEDAVSLRIDRKLEDCLVDGELSDSIRHSILLLVGVWYNSREAVSFGGATEIPYTADFLFNLNKCYNSGF